MANFIAVDDVQAEQIKPFGRAGSRTQVLVKFSVSGAPREFVEVYATTDIGAFDAPRLGTIPINLHSNEYSAMLDLVAGMRYEIRCCPRTTTNGDPDETMDGESWVDRCNTIGFVTEADADFPKPVIFSAIPRHRTLRRKNHIRIQWESPRAYTFYQVRFGNERSGFQEQQIDRIAGGIGGVFPLEPTIPGVRYLFKVNGLMRNSFETGSSGFTEPIFVTAAENTRSLRAFMDGVDTSGGIRALIPAHISSLRALLETNP